jgi:hypothetical protein
VWPSQIVYHPPKPPLARNPYLPGPSQHSLLTRGRSSNGRPISAGLRVRSSSREPIARRRRSDRWTVLGHGRHLLEYASLTLSRSLVSQQTSNLVFDRLCVQAQRRKPTPSRCPSRRLRTTPWTFLSSPSNPLTPSLGQASSLTTSGDCTSCFILFPTSRLSGLLTLKLIVVLFTSARQTSSCHQASGWLGIRHHQAWELQGQDRSVGLRDG